MDFYGNFRSRAGFMETEYSLELNTLYSPPFGMRYDLRDIAENNLHTYIAK